MSAQPHLPGFGSPCRIVSLDHSPGRLADLALTSEVLLESVAEGDKERRRKTLSQYPRNFPGIVFWAETLATLRRQLIRQRVGWKGGRSGNYETVYLESRATAVAVVGGDKNTGIDALSGPRLARKRGPMTTARVRHNVEIDLQLTLDLDFGSERSAGLAPDEACQTWFLVMFADENEVRVELSLPSGLNEDGVVSRWIERIMLPALPATGAVVPIDPDEDDEDDDDNLVTRQ